MCDGDCCNLVNRSVSTKTAYSLKTATTSLSVMCLEAIYYLISICLLLINSARDAGCIPVLQISAAAVAKR